MEWYWIVTSHVQKGIRNLEQKKTCTRIRQFNAHNAPFWYVFYTVCANYSPFVWFWRSRITITMARFPLTWTKLLFPTVWDRRPPDNATFKTFQWAQGWRVALYPLFLEEIKGFSQETLKSCSGYASSPCTMWLGAIFIGSQQRRVSLALSPICWALMSRI